MCVRERECVLERRCKIGVVWDVSVFMCGCFVLCVLCVCLIILILVLAYTHACVSTCTCAKVSLQAMWFICSSGLAFGPLLTQLVRAGNTKGNNDGKHSSNSAKKHPHQSGFASVSQQIARPLMNILRRAPDGTDVAHQYFCSTQKM